MPTLSPQTQQAVTQAAETYVKKLLHKDHTGHDWYHIQRVRTVAGRIAKAEGANMFLADLMALLHESTDKKLIGKKTENQALLEVRTLLSSEGLDDKIIEEILYFITHQSYSKSGVRREQLDSFAGQCAQDADRLEAIGAIGIARCFAFNGKIGNPVHDPTIPVKLNISPKEYAQYKATSINHFYEKMLKIKDLVNTKTGKKLAQHRHQVVEDFLKEFLAEWDGKK